MTEMPLPPSTSSESSPSPRPASHKKLLVWITFVFVFLGLCTFLLWFFILRFRVSTEDAYVQGNQIVVTSQIQGFIASVSVDDSNFVEKNRILVTLDPIDAELTLQKSKDQLALVTRQVVQLFEQVHILQADIVMKQAELTRREQDLNHREALIRTGSISLEDLQHATAAFFEASASLQKTQHQLRAAIAMIEGTVVATHPMVRKAIDELKEAFVNRYRCTIYSPVTGLVGVKRAEVGEAISPQTPLMQIIPLDQIWVDANFKETHLKKVRIGQPVKLTADMYGREIVFHGKVSGIGAATGAIFSVLPPQNATGNWIKIVQRLPVRIALDPKELEIHPLRLGLSMHVKIDLHDMQGPMIPPSPPPGPLYQTEIFAEQEKGVDDLIQDILNANGAFSLSQEKRESIGDENNDDNA